MTLSGAAGAVAPQSAVVAATLETGHFTTAQATTDGSFTATLFAPAGTSVLIKADPDDATVERFLNAPRGVDHLFFSNGEQGGSSIALTGLPGTILRVSDPPGTGIQIGSAGRTDWRDPGLPAWTFQGTLNTQTLAPGDPLRIRGTIRVDSPALQGLAIFRWERPSGLSGSPTPRGRVFSAGTPLRPPSSLLLGYRLNGNPELGCGLRGAPTSAFGQKGSHSGRSEVDLTLSLPPGLPAGYYRPFLKFYFSNIPAENPPSRSVINLYTLCGPGFV